MCENLHIYNAMLHTSNFLFSNKNMLNLCSFHKTQSYIETHTHTVLDYIWNGWENHCMVRVVEVEVTMIF